MKQVAEFEIVESFNITRIGLIILGNIVSGSINHDDIIEFNISDKTHQLKIAALHYARKAKVFPDMVGLSFSYTHDSEKEFYNNLKVTPQIGLIMSEV
ncbi:hypothetical protein ACFGVR_04785 [Mucilaginibacter sp. AW1-3]